MAVVQDVDVTHVAQPSDSGDAMGHSAQSTLPYPAAASFPVAVILPSLPDNIGNQGPRGARMLNSPFIPNIRCLNLPQQPHLRQQGCRIQLEDPPRLTIGL